MAFFSSRRQSESDSREDQTRQAPPVPGSPIGFSTVLGANSEMEGTLISKGNVRMDGTFTGTLDITGNVLVGETAQINADIDARNISIAGAVRGNVSGNKVQILRTGRVWGDISASALTTEEGAFIDGRITMTGHAASVQETAEEELDDAVIETEPVSPEMPEADSMTDDEPSAVLADINDPAPEAEDQSPDPDNDDDAQEGR